MRLLIAACLFAISFAQTDDSWGWGEAEVEVKTSSSERSVMPYMEFSDPENIMRPPWFKMTKERRRLQEILNMEIPLGEIEVSGKFRDAFKKVKDKFKAKKDEWKAALKDKAGKKKEKLKGQLEGIKSAFTSGTGKMKKWGTALLAAVKDIVVKIATDFVANVKDTVKSIGTAITDIKESIKSLGGDKSNTKKIFAGEEPDEAALGTNFAKTAQKASKIRYLLGLVKGTGGKWFLPSVGFGWTKSFSLGLSAGWTTALFGGLDVKAGQTPPKDLSASLALLTGFSWGGGADIGATSEWGLTFCWNTAPKDTQGFGVAVNIGVTWGGGATLTLGWAWDTEGNALRLNCIGLAAAVGAQAGATVVATYAQTLWDKDITIANGYFDEQKEGEEALKDVPDDEKKKLADASNALLGGSEDQAVQTAAGGVADAPELPETDWDAATDDAAAAPAPAAGGGGKTGRAEVKVAALPNEEFISEAMASEKAFSDFTIQITFAGIAFAALLLAFVLATSNSEKKSASYKLLGEESMDV